MPARGLGPNVSILIDNKPLSNDLREGIIDAELNRTIEGASTVVVKVRDPQKLWRQAGVFDAIRGSEELEEGGRRSKSDRHEAELILSEELPGGGTRELCFVIAGATKKVDEYTITFEDREMHMLREDDQPARMVRSARDHNLAHFVRMLIERRFGKIGEQVGFHCPELNVIQPVEQTKQQVKADLRVGGGRGKYTVNGENADTEQENNINIVLQVCDDLKTPEAARIAIIEAGIAESSFRSRNRNPKEGADGVFQLIPSTAASTGLSPFDTEGTARHWLQTGYYGKGGGIELAHKGMAPGEIALAVEGAAVGPGFFDAHESEAKKIIAAAGVGSESAPAGREREPVVYEVNQPGEKEEEPNTLRGIEEYAKKYGWRFFKIGTEFYFMHDSSSLKTQNPKLSNVSEDMEGILDVQWELDCNVRAKKSTVSIECRAYLWNPEPGQAVTIAESVGPAELAEGKWIVFNIERPDITDNATLVELVRPVRAKAEKVGSLKLAGPKQKIVRTPNAPGGRQQLNSNGSLKGDSQVQQVAFNCEYLVDHQPRYIYIFGGGHANLGEPGGEQRQEATPGGLRVTEVKGYDCSGAVSAALGGGNADLLARPMDTRELANWGEAGKGQYLTVWVKSNPGEADTEEHCLIELTLPTPIIAGQATTYFECGGRRPGTGPSFYGTPYPSDLEAAGFKPRHYPGT